MTQAFKEGLEFSSDVGPALEKADCKIKVRYDNSEWYLGQFHFHTPAEHIIDNTRHIMEVHHVLYKSGQHGKKAMVIGVMIDIGSKNDALEELTGGLWSSGWPTYQRPASSNDYSTPKSVRPTGKNPFGLLPKNLDYLRYKGGLTTPPCSEIVEWILMKEPISISQSQWGKYIQHLAKIPSANNQMANCADRDYQTKLKVMPSGFVGMVQKALKNSDLTKDKVCASRKIMTNKSDVCSCSARLNQEDSRPEVPSEPDSKSTQDTPSDPESSSRDDMRVLM
jgi:carbonic anhydrase